MKTLKAFFSKFFRDNPLRILRKPSNNSLKVLSLLGLSLGVLAVVYINLQEKAAVNESRLPEKVATERYFNRWLTNLKNKDVEIEGKEFFFIEEREALSMSVLKVYSVEDPIKKEQLDLALQNLQDTSHVAFAPNNRIFLDYRDEFKDGFLPGQVRLFGQKENKIIEARIVDCYTPHNCYFDRAYFLTNDYFVIHEVSLADKLDLCTREEVCAHTFKTHLVDLINNKVKTYYSEEKLFSINAWIDRNK